MKFFVYSRQHIEATTPHEVTNLIVSIRTPGDPKEAKLPIGPLTVGVLRMDFHDIDHHPPEVEHLLFTEEKIDPKTLFTDTMAQTLLAFVKEKLPVEHFLVHCDAGWSRSPAVAAAFSKITTGVDEEYFRRFHPNMRVYGAILRAHFGQ